MVDGIKLNFQIEDFRAWKSAVNFDIDTKINLDTGQVSEKRYVRDTCTKSVIKHEGTVGFYSLQLNEVKTESHRGQKSYEHYLQIEGSVHKNHCNGENYSFFSVKELRQEIEFIQYTFALNPSQARVTNIEIGSNLTMEFPVLPFLNQHLVSYKGKGFSRYSQDRNGKQIGSFCSLSQYVVKLYDKSLLYGLQDRNLLRFELRFKKMERLNRIGIRYLSDLQDETKMRQLIDILLQSWSNILLGYSEIQPANRGLSSTDKDLLTFGAYTLYWENLRKASRQGYYKKVRRYKELITEYGIDDHERIGGRLLNNLQKVLIDTI